MTVIIDYDAGNIRSVEKAFHFLGEDTLLTKDTKEILSADRVVFPGVGSFGPAMKSIHESGLKNIISEVVEREIPFLGICLGYQLLFSGSEEDGGVEGLGIFKGHVKKFASDKDHKVPQIGWNSLDIKKASGLFAGTPTGSYFYFVHSYYVECEDRSLVASTTDYVNTFDSAIDTGSLFACQFHPEKSSHEGLNLLQNFLETKAGDD